MPEHLDINVLFRVPPRASERRSLTKRLLAIVEPWIGSPDVLTVYDVDTWEFREQPWSSGADLLEKEIRGGSRTYIYGDRQAGAAGSLALEEACGLACYSLSVPLPRLSDVSLESLETTLLRIYTECESREPCILIAGPELVVKLRDGDFAQIVESQFRDTSLVTSIIGPENKLSSDFDDLSVAQRNQDTVVLRHRHAALRLGKSES